MRDIDLIIKALRRRHPDLNVERLEMTQAADDRGIWLLNLPSASIELQLESSSGNCPFLIQSSLSAERLHAASIGETINMVSAMLGSHDNAA